MTAIAIWCNHERAENPGLWIAADSRVSNSSGSALINDAAKVFALPVICRSPDENGWFTQRYYDHTYGYCFAGDTLLGQNAYLSLVPLLSNLASSKSYIPTLADVAEYIRTYLSLTFDDCKGQRGEHSLFEVAVFGHCIKTNSLSAYHFMPTREDGLFKITCKTHENMQENDFVYLGDQKAYMQSQIRAALAVDRTGLEDFMAACAGRPLSRMPRYVIQDHINEKRFDGIGGDIQLGIADKFGFRAYRLCKPGDTGTAEMTYLGRKLTSDLQYVGGPFGALVGGDAMV